MPDDTNSRPWIAISGSRGVEYLTANHYRWIDTVAELGCDHAAVEANGRIEYITCDNPGCRDAFRKLCLAELQEIAERFDASLKTA